jgi:hypothetical protein
LNSQTNRAQSRSRSTSRPSPRRVTSCDGRQRKDTVIGARKESLAGCRHHPFGRHRQPRAEFRRAAAHFTRRGRYPLQLRSARADSAGLTREVS